jgi:general secretion pathway protein D
LNAKWISAAGAAAGAAWLSVCLTSTAIAAPPTTIEDAPSANRAGQADRLTRGDVDQLLRRARTAIRDKNLDLAEALTARAESADVRYPLFHFGPTPGSVRIELNQTRKSLPAGALTPSNISRSGVTTAGYESGGAADPFIERPLAVPAIHNHVDGTPDNRVQPASATDDPWAMRDAPLPPSLGARRLDAETAPQLVAPLRSESPVTADTAYASGSSATPGDAKSRTLELLRSARQALEAGNLDQAEALARDAGALAVPESAFLPHEDRPSTLAWDIHRARSTQSPESKVDTMPRVATEANVAQNAASDRYAAQARLSVEQNEPRNVPAPNGANLSEMRFSQLPEPLELPGNDPDFFDNPSQSAPAVRPLSVPEEVPSYERLPDGGTTAGTDAAQLLLAGEEALRDRDQQTAAVLFGQAYLIRDQLTSAEQSRLQKHLQLLSSNESTAGTTAPRPAAPTLIDTTVDSQEVLARQLSAEVGKKQSEARRLREEDPEKALKTLQDTRQAVDESQLTGDFRSQLLRRIDITLDETEKYIRDNRAEIDLDRRNQAVLEEIDRSREVKVKVQQKVAELVDEFNRLRDEQRYAEMEVVARRLIELAPEEDVAQQVWQNAKFIRRTMMNNQLAEARENSYWNALDDVERSSLQEVGDGHELIYDEKTWNALVKNRKGSADRNAHRTERELEIERRLKTPVLLRYEDAPLSEVVQGLSELAGVNMHLDPRGLDQEGINSNTPVTINLSKEISLKSALNLILEPLHLTYVIKDEVLKVTSEQLRDGVIYPYVYNVADLVIPIPNFVPNNNIGLQGLINDAHAAMGNGPTGLGMPGPTVLVNDPGPRGQAMPGSGNVLAQQFGAGGMGGSPSASVPIGSGPGGMGGGANADFDSLIDLIVSTIASETWAENGGGEAEIRPFPTNLSLVISQTQAVHEEIADLLEQLRRLQDLQVTIEVRFIRLNDSFFERIGVDFDMNIEDRSIGTNDVTPGSVWEGSRQSLIAGLQTPVSGIAPFPNFTSDLDIPFRQNSFDLTAPFIGGGAAPFPSFGFAILSDIEAFFLIEAAQGDRRTNVLNAPKVTLFNGQQAFVADAVSMPFVIGVIPVVGEFAAAQQPVIVVLNEGTLMTIQAVVSDDRRYVRLTVVPFFTQVGDVQEFTFDGASSSTNMSSTTDDDEGNTVDESESEGTTRSGVTVQLPAFQFIAVVTTVSVPDGGTVLLGGIKRLSEGRNEVGVPLLSKLPYINRLFRNIGIGRETDSLMMMVTPRIIIQEEEEERLGVVAP